jgi:hypothetical protein
MNNNSNKHGFGSTDWLVSAIKKNPEGLLLMAAGCALLLRTGNSSNRQREEAAEPSVMYILQHPLTGPTYPCCYLQA